MKIIEDGWALFGGIIENGQLPSSPGGLLVTAGISQVDVVPTNIAISVGGIMDISILSRISGLFSHPHHLIDVFITIRDDKGNIERKVRAKSLVRGFAFVLSWGLLGGTAHITTVKDTDGVDRALGGASSFFTYKSDAGVTTYGIVVGTGATAVTQADYSLDTLITQGVGAGQLQYGSVSHTEPITVEPSSSWTVSRTVVNGSVGDITWNEIGIYLYTGTGWYFMAERTLQTTTINVGASKTITYTFSITL